MVASLYVGDLAADVTESQLKELFGQVAEVENVRVCKDVMTGRSLGYAYVNYNNREDAEKAISVLNFTILNLRPIRISFSRRDSTIRKSGAANVFVKNLHSSIDNKGLHDTFSVYGTILSCKIEYDANGKSKGFGFVQFDNEESAQNAIDYMNGMWIGDKPISVCHFVRKQERVPSL